MMEHTLELGFARKPLVEQLEAQGLPFNRETIEHLDRDADAVSRLKCRGVVGYAAGNRLYDKIFKLVWAEVRRAVKATEAE